MTVFDTTFFAEFLCSSLFGILVGYILHGLLRAPRWLVEKLVE